MRSEAQLVRDNEVRDARRMRGQCKVCGHSWTPRNRSRGVNRCPGCGSRGNVTYKMLNDDPLT